MDAETYRIVFKGEILPAKDLDVVKVSMAQIFSMDVKQVQSLFSGKAVSVKSGLDRATAQKFKQGFERAGALAYIIADNGRKLPPIEASAKAKAEDDTTLRRGAPVPMTCPDCNQEQPLAPSCAFCGWTSPAWGE